MTAVYRPDPKVNLRWYTGDGPGFVAASRAMRLRGDLRVHRPCPPAVQVRRQRAWVEIPAVVEVQPRSTASPQTSPPTPGSATAVPDATTRGGPVALDCIDERDTITAVLPTTAPQLDGAPAPYRPAYAVLAWYLDRRTYMIGPDLRNDDRPAERDAHDTRTLDRLRATEGDPT